MDAKPHTRAQIPDTMATLQCSEVGAKPHIAQARRSTDEEQTMKLRLASISGEPPTDIHEPIGGDDVMALRICPRNANLSCLAKPPSKRQLGARTTARLESRLRSLVRVLVAVFAPHLDDTCATCLGN